MIDRKCDGCNKCCQGHLTATIYGFEMYPGKPCHFASKTGCSIYPHRPADPCKGFKCVWKSNVAVPISFKPDEIGMIMIDAVKDGIPYVSIVSAGNEISLEVIDWAVSMVNSGKIENIVYRQKNSIRVISHNKDFVDKFTEST
jgi:hypothetical protein